MSENEAVATPRAMRAISRHSNERLQILGAWYAAEHERLYRFTYLLTRDQHTAEDLVQEAFVRIYRAGVRAEGPGLSAYARRTVINLLRSSLRRRTVEHRLLERLTSERPSSPTDRDSGLDVRRALLMLSVADRACLALRYFEDQSDHEIGLALGISEGAAKKRLQRAQARLRTLMPKEES